MGRPKYEGHIIPQDIPLDIVFEDDDVLVINKPAGMVVHPGCGNYTGTLVNAIAWHLRDNPDYDPDDPDVGLVHRIDKDTSGLIVAAKTPEAKTALGRQFYDKTTRRLYNALVWGRFDEPCGRIEGNIARHPQDRMQMAVFPPDSGIGKHAVTHYRVIENLGYVTLVECRLETGRTHRPCSQKHTDTPSSATKDMEVTKFCEAPTLYDTGNSSETALKPVHGRPCMQGHSDSHIRAPESKWTSPARFPKTWPFCWTNGETT